LSAKNFGKLMSMFEESGMSFTVFARSFTSICRLC